MKRKKDRSAWAARWIRRKQPYMVVEPEQLSFLKATAGEMAAFEREVHGTREPTASSLLLGTHVAFSLWDRRGRHAQWADLDVDDVYDRCCKARAALHPALYASLMALITWLSKHQRLEPSRAQAMLDKLAVREPPEITRLRESLSSGPSTVWH